MSEEAKPPRRPRSADGSIFKHKIKLKDKGKERDRTVYEVRKRYKNSEGVWREKKRRVDAFHEVPAAKRAIEDEIKKELEGETLSAKARTFDELAAYYEKHYLIAPVYAGKTKVAGLRSHVKQKSILKTLRSHFSGRRLSTISYDDLRAYKRLRLAQPTRTTKAEPAGHQRSLVGVHRELQCLRRMLQIALRRGWIEINPFTMGDVLISAAAETKRMRILSHEEEKRLLAACGDCEVTYLRKGREVTARNMGARRTHLRPLIVAALDTGMRLGELLKLTWAEVNSTAGLIVVPAFNTKTAVARVVPLTSRLRLELELYREASAGDNDLVFGVLVSVKTSFVRVCKRAQIVGLRFHDLRHTAITRMVRAGVPHALVMQVSGHSQMTTFGRYINVDSETAVSIAESLNRFAALQVASESARAAPDGRVH